VKARIAGAAAACGIAVALVGTSVGSASGDAPTKRGDEVTIKAKLKRGFPVYKGPETVPAGGSITVFNKTSPAQTGPHTFAIVEKDELPKGERQRKKCGKAANRKLVCKDISEAHEMGTTNTAAIQSVDNGLLGTWDAAFDGDEDGDTWYSTTQGETHTRAVPEEPTKLYYLCIVWPRMQGSIKVVE
jgi:hypothetical protein